MTVSTVLETAPETERQELSAPPVHGGRLREAAKRFGRPLEDWIDLSTGINPNGWPVPVVPPGVWARLPEDDDGLEIAAERYYAASGALPLAGSQAAIQLLPTLRPPGRVGIPEVGYREHAHAWHRAGHRVISLPDGDPGDRLDDGPEHERLDVLVVINPNNPSGARWSVATLLDWHARLAERGGWLIVDEAFMDVTPAASLLPYVGRPGLVVLRSLGKFFGLAGARAGFVLAEPVVLDRLRESLGPWAVTGPSRWVAARALSDHAWQVTARHALDRARSRLADLLKRQRLPVAGGTELFQWAPIPDAAFWRDALARRGILVRHFTDPPALRFGLPGGESAWRRLELALAGVRAERLR